MAQKTPTAWQSNPAKSAGVAYSDPNTPYSGATVAYSSATVGLDEFSKSATAWSSAGNKTATGWSANPAAETNEYTYDSATKIYDSAADTYDGVVAGQDTIAEKTATAWSSL